MLVDITACGMEGVMVSFLHSEIIEVGGAEKREEKRVIMEPGEVTRVSVVAILSDHLTQMMRFHCNREW